MILKAVSAAGYQPGEHVFVGLDCAASEFFKRESGQYSLRREGPQPGRAVDIYASYVENYPLISIEDGVRRERLGHLEEAHRSPGR
jgi:enolase